MWQSPSRFDVVFVNDVQQRTHLRQNFDQNNFWSLTVARNCKAVTAKKGCHRFFHLNNISRAFSPRSQWHYPKSTTCHFFQSMRRHFSPEKCLAANNIPLMRKRNYPFLHFAIFLEWKNADRFASRRRHEKNKLGDRMIKQLLNSVIAKYRDL